MEEEAGSKRSGSRGEDLSLLLERRRGLHREDVLLSLLLSLGDSLVDLDLLRRNLLLLRRSDERWDRDLLPLLDLLLLRVDLFRSSPLSSLVRNCSTLSDHFSLSSGFSLESRNWLTCSCQDEALAKPGRICGAVVVTDSADDGPAAATDNADEGPAAACRPRKGSSTPVFLLPDSRYEKSGGIPLTSLAPSSSSHRLSSLDWPRKCLNRTKSQETSSPPLTAACCSSVRRNLHH